jgi:very-short-patch-repair endonuclease
MHSNHHYNKYLKHFARENRNAPTKGETIVWDALLKNRKTGYRCLRQRSIDRYIADFFFPEVNLVSEIDGYSHTCEEKIISDRKRDEDLMKLGYKTIRIVDRFVFEDLGNVQGTIEYELEKRRLELGLPLPERKSNSGRT